MQTVKAIGLDIAKSVFQVHVMLPARWPSSGLQAKRSSIGGLFS